VRKEPTVFHLVLDATATQAASDRTSADSTAGIWQVEPCPVA
jgi:hypothetical protein